MSTIAALHFDFHTALSHSNISDTQNKYKEDATNIIVLNTIFKNLKNIKEHSMNSNDMMTKLDQLLKFSGGICPIKNPYFKVFFGIL